jgi:hypothetical protein
MLSLLLIPVCCAVFTTYLTTPGYSFTPTTSTVKSASQLPFDYTAPIELFEVSGWFRVTSDPVTQTELLNLSSLSE